MNGYLANVWHCRNLVEGDVDLDSQTGLNDGRFLSA